MNILRLLAGVLILLLDLLTVSYAEETLEFNCPKPDKEIIIKDPSAVWLDGTVCFEGRSATNTEQAYRFAKAHRLEFSSNSIEFWRLVRNKVFVHIKDAPDIPLKAFFDTPFVLPSTAEFTRNLANEFSAAECGDLGVTGGGRFKVFWNSSKFSVHPAGMAVDIRTKDLNDSCMTTLIYFLYQAEANLQADVSIESSPSHFHVVVIPELPVLIAKTTLASAH